MGLGGQEFRVRAMSGSCDQQWALGKRCYGTLTRVFFKLMLKWIQGTPRQLSSLALGECVKQQGSVLHDIAQEGLGVSREADRFALRKSIVVEKNWGDCFLSCKQHSNRDPAGSCQRKKNASSSTV